MKTKDLRNLNATELNTKLKEFSDEFLKLRFQAASTQVKNPLKKRELRRSIAKIKTLLREEAIRGKS